ncbi:Flp pilus assembly complex ATPase component TadA [Candidatus Micrarchaeota archaeon]|nr:Flp pilus assembly complex ATPase component TadA [Candidatus Micrarchaeota archaeon]MBI5176653.1 Flp pilus assembly complex ATPase component TadA [Candidatus Micrarchaeota archaeon]
MKIIVPDTGVLIDGRITELVEKQGESGASVRVIVPYAAVAELEFQANSGRETGFAGLQELKRLSELGKHGKITIEFAGERPDAFEIERARYGEIDAKIRELAKKSGGTLLTTDKVQREVAAAEGIEVIYLEPVVEKVSLSLSKFFDAGNVMSVHLKEGCTPKAKMGKPGDFALTELATKPLSRKEVEALVREAVEFSKRNANSFIEIDKKGATVLQVGDYRITYTKPPFSEAAEATIVKPLVKLSLSDYNLGETLKKRLDKEAEGIVISGPPGSGKSTFATALAEHYQAKGAIVKTLEQPRDLQVNREITQYAPLEGSFTNTADILLLVRPDYTVFDEVRKPVDFEVFSDLRMAGIGMLGVVHASKPIDAIQRFIGKIDLGVIPQVVDTVVFIQRGVVKKVYSLSFTVRVPSGMREADLARPVIEVKDFETGQAEYELYKWGEETVVLPLHQASLRPSSGRDAAFHDAAPHGSARGRPKWEDRGGKKGNWRKRGR